MLFGVSAADPVSYIAVVGLLLARRDRRLLRSGAAGDARGPDGGTALRVDFRSRHGRPEFAAAMAARTPSGYPRNCGHCPKSQQAFPQLVMHDLARLSISALIYCKCRSYINIGLESHLPIFGRQLNQRPLRNQLSGARMMNVMTLESTTETAATQPRVLIADDQPDILEALRLLLKGHGYVTEAVTSPAALFAADFPKWIRSDLDGP